MLNIEWNKQIDGDVQGKRGLSIGHAITFDPNIPGGGMHAISVSAKKDNVGFNFDIYQILWEWIYFQML